MTITRERQSDHLGKRQVDTMSICPVFAVYVIINVKKSVKKGGTL